MADILTFVGIGSPDDVVRTLDVDGFLGVSEGLGASVMLGGGFVYGGYVWMVCQIKMRLERERESGRTGLCSLFGGWGLGFGGVVWGS